MKEIRFNTEIGEMSIRQSKARTTISQRDAILKRSQTIELLSVKEIQSLIDALREIEYELNNNS